MYQAFFELGEKPEETIVVSGIGCSGKTPHFINTTGIHTLHGRPIPFAQGIKLSNPRLTVVVNSGDGDLLGIGMGHFVALGRRNIDITVIMHNNTVYALTKGQASPTLEKGLQPKSLPLPNIQDPIDAVGTSILSGYTFVARAYSAKVAHLKEVIKRAINHKGSSFVDVLQPCVTWDDIHTYDYYNSRVYDINDTGWAPAIDEVQGSYEKSLDAIKISQRSEDKIPIGIFLEDNSVSTYGERISQRLYGYAEFPPATQDFIKDGRPAISEEDFRNIFGKYIVRIE